MRVDLLTSPKVVRMASALCADRFKIVGGLLSVWSLFDAHSEDGILIGYSADMLDELGAWSGFSASMIAVGWLIDNGQSLELPRFDSHNGASAKRRAQDADRKRDARKESSLSADKNRTREEKRREERILNNTSAQAPSDALENPDPVEPIKSAKPKPDYPEWFTTLWLIYPPRAGSNDKRKAYQAACARIKDGYTHEQLEAATHRYRVWCLATGKLNTEYIKAAASFYGPGGHLDNPWEVTHGSHHQSPASGSSASQRPFADTVRDQARTVIERLSGDAVHGQPSSGTLFEDGCVVSEQGQIGRADDVR